MSLARSIARPLARSLANSVASSEGGGYQTPEPVADSSSTVEATGVSGQIRFTFSTAPETYGAAILDMAWTDNNADDPATANSLGVDSGDTFPLVRDYNGLTDDVAITNVYTAVKTAGGWSAWSEDIGPVTPTGFDSDAQAIFDQYASEPDSTHKSAINTLVTTLKSDGLWAKMDGLFVHATSEVTGALVDWKNPTSDASPVNSPAFTTDQGYKGNDSSSYVDSGFNPSTDGGNYGANDATIFAWNLDTPVGAGTLFGNSSGNDIQLILNSLGNNITTIRLNDSAINPTVSGQTDHSGLWSASRRAADDLELYHNGSSILVNTATATASEPNGTMRVLAGGGGFTDAEAAVWGYGGGLTDAEHSDLYDALAAYLTAVGAI